MIEKLMELLRQLLKWDDVIVELPVPTSVPTTPPEVPAVAPKPPETVSKTVPVPSNREKFYATAKACLGVDMSPTDLAPDSLGCAESLNGVFVKAFGKPILKNVVGTAALLEQLKRDKRFKEVATPTVGDIVMNATGTSTKGAKNGHTGIWGKNNVMSNNSATGKWDAHYTLADWRAYFEVKLGFKSRYFRVI